MDLVWSGCVVGGDIMEKIIELANALLKHYFKEELKPEDIDLIKKRFPKQYEKLENATKYLPFRILTGYAGNQILKSLGIKKGVYK